MALSPASDLEAYLLSKYMEAWVLYIEESFHKQLPTAQSKYMYNDIA